MSNAPDRIAPYTHEADDAADWRSDWLEDPSCAGLYLLSTPAREHADELVDALRGLVDPFIGCISAEKVHAACNLLTKIKEASNE